MKGLSLEVVTPLLDIAQDFVVFLTLYDEKRLKYLSFALWNIPDDVVPQNSFNELIASVFKQSITVLM